MNVVERLRSLFVGWRAVFATAIMTFWGYGLHLYGFGAYVTPLSQEFGWSRAQISAAQGMGRLEGGIEGPWGGWLTDKYGPRLVNFIGVFIFGLGLIMMYFVNSLLSFYIIWSFIVTLGFNLGMLGPLEKAIADWFVKKRGLAMGLSRFTLGLGGATIPTLMTYIILKYDWRIAFVIAGLVTWGLCLPLTWLFIKPHRPEYYGLMPDGVESKKEKETKSIIEAGQEYAAEVGELEFSVRQVIKTRVFWVICVYNMLMSMSISCINVHQIPHLIDMGLDPMAAAGALGFTIFMSVPARIPAGYISDRLQIHQIKYLWISSVFFVGLGIFFLMIATHISLVYVSAVFYGIGLGLRTGSRSPLMARYFGRKGFATIGGTTGIISLPVGFFAPIYIGWVYDVTGSYFSAFSQALALVIVAFFLLFFLNPPKLKQKVKSDIGKFL